MGTNGVDLSGLSDEELAQMTREIASNLSAPVFELLKRGWSVDLLTSSDWGLSGPGAAVHVLIEQSHVTRI